MAAKTHEKNVKLFRNQMHAFMHVRDGVGGFELGEIELPHLIRSVRGLGERGFAGQGELAAFALIFPGATTSPRHATTAAQSIQKWHGRRGDTSPRSCGVPTPDAPTHALTRRRGQRVGPASATGPSAVRRPGRGPADAATSVQACRNVHRTSQSTCPLQHGSPRGPQRAQAALR